MTSKTTDQLILDAERVIRSGDADERERAHRMGRKALKVLENRLRRQANRMGMVVMKSRRRDPAALDSACTL